MKTYLYVRIIKDDAIIFINFLKFSVLAIFTKNIFHKIFIFISSFGPASMGQSYS